MVGTMKRQWYRMTTAEVMRAIFADGAGANINANRQNDCNKPLFLPKTSWPIYQYAVERDGRVQRRPITDIMIGDVISLNVGDIVPATLRLIKSSSLAAQEDMILGGSTISYKKTFAIKSLLPMTQQKNMLFAGSYIIKGSGKAVVVALTQDNQLLPRAVSIRARSYAKKGIILQRADVISILPKVDSVFFDDLHQSTEIVGLTQLAYMQKGVTVTFFVQKAVAHRLEQLLPKEVFQQEASGVRIVTHQSKEQKAHMVLLSRRQGGVAMYVHRGTDITSMPKIADINVVIAQHARQRAIQQADIAIWQISTQNFTSILYNKK